MALQLFPATPSTAANDNKAPSVIPTPALSIVIVTPITALPVGTDICMRGLDEKKGSDESALTKHQAKRRVVSVEAST